MRKPVLHKNSQRGQAIVLIAALMVALIAALGLAIDGGGMFLLYRDVQNATDAAGLTAAFALCTGDNPESAVEISASMNGFENGVDGVTVETQNPPTDIGDPKYHGDSDYVGIRITAEKPSYFIQVVYDGPLSVTSETVAECQPEDLHGFPENTAIVLLNQASCSGGTPLLHNGSTSTIYVDGNIYVNHNNAACNSVDILQGSSSFFIMDGKLCTQSSAIRTDLNGQAITDGPSGAELETDCDDVPQLTGTAATDPLGLVGNEPSCGPNQGDINNYDGGVAPPGTYDNLSVAAGNDVTLGAGVFCITDNSLIQGTITSEPNGVMIYVQGNHDINSTNTAVVDITAMNSGPYAGLLIYSEAVGGTGVQWNGHSNLGLTGTLYAPQTTCEISGGDNTIITSQFICNNFHLTGDNGEVMIFYEPSAVFRKPPSFGITQ